MVRWGLSALPLSLRINCFIELQSASTFQYLHLCYIQKLLCCHMHGRLDLETDHQSESRMVESEGKHSPTPLLLSWDHLWGHVLHHF